MKNERKKRIYCIFVLLCMLTTSLSAGLQTIYAQKNAEKTSYTAFGDSIAAGYGLDGYSNDQTKAPADSYQTLVAQFLHTQSVNYAVTGNKSDDCIQLLRSEKADEALADTDIITLSIGSNDLLLPFIQIVMDELQIQPETLDPASIEEQLKNGFTIPSADLSKMTEYFKKAEQLMEQLSDNATLHAQAAAFEEKFQTILAILHEKAPNADIYATNIYNPFASVPRIGELADIYIKEINQAFSEKAADYKLIDVYTPFCEKELTNVNIEFKQPYRLQLDPHPSVQGHEAIAELITEAIKQTYAPNAAVLNSLSSGSKKKLTVKAALPVDADGYQVLYAASKNGNYKTLGNTNKKTFQTNSKKLKSKKTYYIKLQSFKVINEVTYFGKDSKVKKVIIK